MLSNFRNVGSTSLHPATWCGIVCDNFDHVSKESDLKHRTRMFKIGGVFLSEPAVKNHPGDWKTEHAHSTNVLILHLQLEHLH